MSRLIVPRSIMLLNKWIACVSTTMPSYSLHSWIGEVACCFGALTLADVHRPLFFSHEHGRSIHFKCISTPQWSHTHLSHLLLPCMCACCLRVCVNEWVSLLNTITIKQIILSIAFASSTARDTWRWCPDIIRQWHWEKTQSRLTSYSAIASACASCTCSARVKSIWKNNLNEWK